MYYLANLGWDFNCYIKFLVRESEVKSLKYGDTFWYYIEKYDNMIFDAGHRIRPFVFLKYEEEVIYCLLSSTTKGDCSIKMIHDIDKYYYINTTRLIQLKIDDYLEYKSSLSDVQIEKISRDIYFKKKFIKFQEISKKYLKIVPGDLVRYADNDYLLFGLDSINATLYPLKDNLKTLRVRIAPKIYVDILHPLIVNKTNIELISTGKNEYIEKIKRYKRNNRKMIKMFKSNL